VGERRDGGVPQPPGRLSGPPFLEDVERAVGALPGSSAERRSGYLAVTLELAGDPAGLSATAAALVAAFPAVEGRRTLRVDVRNRHWAALVLEIAAAAGQSR